MSNCDCPSCLAGRREALLDRLTRDSLRVALRHAQFETWAPERATGSLPTTYKVPNTGFKVNWTKQRSLKDVQTLKPADLLKKGQQAVYAIYKKGSKRPLYVGHVHGANQTVFNRLIDHVTGRTAGTASSATGRLSDELKKHLKDAYVQVGTYDAPGYAPTPNMTRVVEGLLQQALHPRFWDSNVTTFEVEEDEFAEDFV
ncbi:MAG TPA: hypothetical protein VH814_05190 [Steroidobacteraceae bacterium]|jgi:hypothetical protein